VTTLLSLVRHGETDWNLRRRIQGLTDIPLNDTGREQARAAGRLLARRSWDLVYTSPLSRALETAQIIAGELGLPEPVLLPAVVERDYGEAEGLDFDEIERRYPGRGSIPGQETREQVRDRVLPALRALAVEHEDAAVLVVSHGGAIRAALTAVDPGQSHGVIRNGSIHSFQVTAGELRLLAFDDPLEASPATAHDLDEQNAVEAREEGVA